MHYNRQNFFFWSTCSLHDSLVFYNWLPFSFTFFYPAALAGAKLQHVAASPASENVGIIGFFLGARPKPYNDCSALENLNYCYY